MNKEEIEHKLEQAKADKFEINKQVQILEAQLREAEKPKLGHGDFGYSSGGSPFVVAEQTTLPGSPKAFFADTSGQQKVDKTMPDAIKLGNIFDLLKEWSEGLEIFTQTGWGGGELKIQIFSDHSIEFRVQGRDATMHLEKAEEFWRKLGQMIATLKRRSPQE